MSRKMLVIALLAGCAGVLDIDVVATEIEGETVVSPANPGVFTVTVRNGTDRRVVWGQGSSSCQVHMIIDEDPRPVEDRACTAWPASFGVNQFS